MKSSIGTVIPKDTCLSLFQGLGRILYKKGFGKKIWFEINDILLFRF